MSTSSESEKRSVGAADVTKISTGHNLSDADVERLLPEALEHFGPVTQEEEAFLRVSSTERFVHLRMRKYFNAASTFMRPIVRHLSSSLVIAASACVVVLIGAGFWLKFASGPITKAPDSDSVTRGGGQPRSAMDKGAEVPSKVGAASPSNSTLASPGKNPAVAIVVGIDNYPPSSKLNKLYGAVNDARRMAEALRRADVTVYSLFDGGTSQPTHSNILKALQSAAETAQGGDFLFYFSGHGLSEGTTAYLMPSDATGAPSLFGISLPKITSAIGANTFRSLVLIADVCKVGASARAPDFVNNLNAQSADWVVITSASPGQAASEDPSYLAQNAAGFIPEAGEPHGRFTYFLLTGRYATERTTDGRPIAAADYDGNGTVTWGEAFQYAKEQTIRRSKQRGTPDGLRPQTPQLIAGNSKLLDEPFLIPTQIPPEANRETINQSQVFPVPLDASKHFVVYRDVDNSTQLPFEPYAWMWGRKGEKNVIAVDSVNRMMDVNIVYPGGPLGQQGTCINWKIVWQGSANGATWDAGWAGLGFFAGEDSPPWWAANGDNRGSYFNLEAPTRFTELYFEARSPTARTRILAKIGSLARDERNKPLSLGDSLAYPLVSESFEIGPKWKKCTVPLRDLIKNINAAIPNHICAKNRVESGACQICGSSDLIPKHNNLERICSLAFVVERYGAPRHPGQPDPNAPVEIFLDEIRFQ